MTLISSLKTILVGFVLVGLFGPTALLAQSTLSLSVSPTLFELSAVPGQSWQSSVKVVNSNPYPITVYADPVNFIPQGEGGQGKFLPVFEEFDQGATLAEWITVSAKEVTIPAEQSRQVPFIVEVPEEAPPGGHFAAILIGTQPPSADAGLQLRTSQIVSSLFFLRIEGEVTEAGAIRSFTSNQSFSETAMADFSLRFENKGNVHLQPQGSITIYNMWGSERGVIPINQQTHFGNVLPESIRKFNFSWSGETTLGDIGRYKAVASLAYGSEKRQFSSQTAHFWVIPVKAAALTLIFLIAVVVFVRWSIKAYVRHMLTLAGVSPVRQKQRTIEREEHDLDLATYQTISAPVRNSLRDLRERMRSVTALWGFFIAFYGYVKTYRIFFTGALVALLIGVVLYWFIGEVTKDRSYSISIDTSGNTITYNSEEVALQALQESGTKQNTSVAEQDYEIIVTNVSGVTGAAAQATVQLIDAGYEVGAVDVDTARQSERSVIIFSADVQNEALKISELFGGALLSANAGASGTIEVLIGTDVVK